MVRGRVVIVAVAVLLLAGGCGGEPEPSQSPSPTTAITGSVTASPSPTGAALSPPSPSPSAVQPAPTAAFEVRGGKVVSGPRRVQVKLGSRVVLEVLSDRADELHLHGYDKQLKVPSGSPARMSVTADIPGVFEIEMHSGVTLSELRVS